MKPWLHNSRARWPTATVLLWTLLAFLDSSLGHGQDAETRPHAINLADVEAFIDSHCLECHHSGEASGDLDLEELDLSDEPPDNHQFPTQILERMLRRIDTRQMPPPAAHRPGEEEYEAISGIIRAGLDDYANRHPSWKNVATMRRLTRLEYQYSIRDLLAIEIDAADYLPRDESSHGFDNITVNELSATHLNRYLNASQAIARAATGARGNGPIGITVRQPADRSQETHVVGLPFGTRGGLVFRKHFHRTGQYEIEIKLTRDRDEKIEGLFDKHDLDVLVDRQRVKRFIIKPPKKAKNWEETDFTHVDSHLKSRIHIDAGEHEIGVTFPKTDSSLTDDKRQPFDANFNRHRHPRRTPAVYQVSLVGPLVDEGPGVTRSRSIIFGDVDPEIATRADARTILQRIATRAYRRPIAADDLEALMPFFDLGFAKGGFEAGVELGLTAILVNPHFLFRIEPVEEAMPGSHRAPGLHPVGGFILASRLSYFLWSSLPDERLLKLARHGKLQEPAILREEVSRMIGDPRSRSLTDNFLSQWLYLRNLDSITPDLRLFPDFDDNLRQAFAQETKLLFADVLKNNRSVTDLIDSDTTFLNQRLATHYGIRGVRGSNFRKVNAPSDAHRGGILRHGSVLTVTSYATRTSPTIRGNWMLENIFGTPAKPPPANVPNLKENTATEVTSVRQRLAVHRENPACASCHDLMDPLGFALENFDAVGRWRTFEGTLPIDSQGQLPDGRQLQSVDELESGIAARPQLFAHTITEKLMTYALGRAVESGDGPAVRRIVSDAAARDYSLAALIEGIVLSEPFRMRNLAAPQQPDNDDSPPPPVSSLENNTP